MWNSRVSVLLAARRFGVDLVERVAIRAFLFRQARVRAEDARLPQDADVGRVDVLVGREGDAVAVLGPVHRVGHVADSEQVAALEERDAVHRRETLAALDLRRDGTKRRIADQPRVE